MSLSLAFHLPRFVRMIHQNKVFSPFTMFSEFIYFWVKAKVAHLFPFHCSSTLNDLFFFLPANSCCSFSDIVGIQFLQLVCIVILVFCFRGQSSLLIQRQLCVSYPEALFLGCELLSIDKRLHNNS